MINQQTHDSKRVVNLEHSFLRLFSFNKFNPRRRHTICIINIWLLPFGWQIVPLMRSVWLYVCMDGSAIFFNNGVCLSKSYCNIKVKKWLTSFTFHLFTFILNKSKASSFYLLIDIIIDKKKPVQCELHHFASIRYLPFLCSLGFQYNCQKARYEDING